MKDNRDPQQIGNAIAATKELHKCSILEAADWVDKHLINGSSTEIPWGERVATHTVASGLLSSPTTNGQAATDQLPGDPA